MSYRNDEVERLKRIRDQQLRARDPQKKQRKLQHNISSRYRSSQESFSFKKLWTGVPQKWRGIILGSFFGVIVLVALPTFIASDLAALVGIAVFFFLMVMGYMIGQAADARDELEDLVKKR
jgi:VIT1/CCC1 family predicted Fe2+/Mn2+ transporter